SITSEDLSENTRMIFVESPGNPTLRVVDIERLAKLAHAHGALLVIDNTFMTAVLQRPLDFGADLVVQSATKFLGGHSDLLAGAVTTNDDELAENIRLSQKVFGGVLEPLTSFRLLQAIKTLPLRIARQQENAEKLVAFLSDHPAVQTVLSAGSFSDAEREVHERQAKGIGAVFSFELAQGYDLKKFLHALEIPSFAVSLGGVESLLSIPATMSHDGMTQAARDRAGITDGLVRFSAGIENIDDLLADFAKALDAAQK
ncbi:MAG: PLP-dependent aspartate aminotransferase family protein, partial [Dermabacter sp.]|nr:PLP-dependent aspartate aminotransferase family protein [Dermabacter sp.]